MVEKGGDRYDAEENSWFRRLQSVKKAQSAIVEYEAKRTVQLCLKKNAMAQSEVYLEEGDSVDLWIAKKKRWQGAFRVLYDSGSTVLVGNLGSIFKHPKSWARLRDRRDAIVTPETTSDSMQKIYPDRLHQMRTRC